MNSWKSRSFGAWTPPFTTLKWGTGSRACTPEGLRTRHSGRCADIAVARATAIDTPTMALAPRCALFAVPSRSMSVLSTSARSANVRPRTASAISPLTFATARSTPLPPKRDGSPSRSSTASLDPVDAPEGTPARARVPSPSVTVTASVGPPRESRISTASTPVTVSSMARPPSTRTPSVPSPLSEHPGRKSQHHPISGGGPWLPRPWTNVEHMFALTGAWDEGLDDAQLAAATHGDGPLVVIAGAGTGKTRALTSRVAWLLERGVAAERILLLTFTRRAADDMLARAAALIGAEPGTRRPRGGTFHAVAHRYVATYAESLGLPDGFTVLDPGEAADLMDLLRGQHGLAGNDVRMPRSADPGRGVLALRQHAAAAARGAGRRLPVVRAAPRGGGRAVPRLHRPQAGGRASLDFDDLLLYWRALLRHEALGPHVAGGFDHVLVDEYQDVNTLQVDIVRALRPDGRGLTVVGRRRAGDLRVPGRRRAAPARVGRPVARRHDRAPGAQLPVPPTDPRPGERRAAAGERGPAPPAQRPARRGRARAWCAATTPRPRRGRSRRPSSRRTSGGSRLREQAVLVRAAHHSDLVEVELSVRRVPYRKYGGFRFLEAAHVKDFVTAARLLDNPHDDVAWFRLLRLHQGIGPARARTLGVHAPTRNRRRPAPLAGRGGRRPGADPHGTVRHASTASPPPGRRPTPRRAGRGRARGRSDRS